MIALNTRGGQVSHALNPIPFGAILIILGDVIELDILGIGQPFGLAAYSAGSPTVAIQAAAPAHLGATGAGPVDGSISGAGVIQKGITVIS